MNSSSSSISGLPIDLRRTSPPKRRIASREIDQISDVNPINSSIYFALICTARSIKFPMSKITIVCWLASKEIMKATESGTVTVLLRHVVSLGESREVSLRALLRLSLDGDDTRVGLVADRAIHALAVVLSQGGSTPSISAVAATVLTSLAMVDVNKFTIGAHPSVFPTLSWLLSKGADCQCMREGATALYDLCKFPTNRQHAVRAGLVPALVKFGMAGFEKAIEVLGQLAKSKEGKAEMRK